MPCRGFVTTNVPHSENHPYIVACIGRFSAEKDQKTLLKAMKHCAHAREIQYSAREMIKMFQDAIDRNHPA